MTSRMRGATGSAPSLPSPQPRSSWQPSSLWWWKGTADGCRHRRISARLSALKGVVEPSAWQRAGTEALWWRVRWPMRWREICRSGISGDLTRREGWGRAAMWLEMRLDSAVFQLTPTRTSTSYELITSFCRSLHISRCYAWEQSFQSKVQDIRNDELSWFRRAQLLAATSYWLKRDYFYPIHLSILSFQQVLLRMDIFHGNNRAEAVIEITEWVEVPKKNLTLESNSTGQNLSKEAGSANGTSDSKENLSSDSDADKSRTPIDKNNAQDIIMEKVLKKRTFRVPLKLVEKTAGAGSILSKESYSEAKTRLSELKDRPAACENARLYLVELQKVSTEVQMILLRIWNRTNHGFQEKEAIQKSTPIYNLPAFTSEEVYQKVLDLQDKVSRVNRIPKPNPKIEKKPPKEEESASSESASKEVESTETSSEPDGP
ncbi:hypothetical protein GUJ93_ZPchr0040g33530 [Zizania palustris]|uniref:Uncharacterized protein n=1 Tax=Zizania palustris TaxID=103762 RepID=A0A8J5R812_ZIZPA|nr:hypothetical protein GUJ93_ZPchr0040g33530 [Zizania palustris]